MTKHTWMKRHSQSVNIFPINDRDMNYKYLSSRKSAILHLKLTTIKDLAGQRLITLQGQTLNSLGMNEHIVNLCTALGLDCDYIYIRYKFTRIQEAPFNH